MRAVNQAAGKVLNSIVGRIGGTGSIKIDNAPGTFMALCAERIGTCKTGPLYSFAHYGKQNGDMMRDPDVVLLRADLDGRWYPVSFRNDYMGLNSIAVYFDDDGEPEKVSPWAQKEIAIFMATWTKNLRHQQDI